MIADDVSYFEEPFFQEGPVGVAIKKVTEEDGVSYFSAAGNNNLAPKGRNIASWEAPQFRDAGSCPSAVVTLSEEFEATEGFGLEPNHCMDFNPGSPTDTGFGITVEEGATLIVDLQWAEPWEGVNTDLDAYLIGPEDKVVAASGENNPADGRPVEIFGWENETGAAANVSARGQPPQRRRPAVEARLASERRRRDLDRVRNLVAAGDVVGPTIFGHDGGEDTISMGAIRYTTNASPETYSSRGPVTHLFGPVNGTIPAAKLARRRFSQNPT